MEARLILFNEHIEIDGIKIGPGEPLYIIAEMGLMHEGSLEKAEEIIRACREADVNAVKTQHFKADNLVCASNPKELAWAKANEVPDEFILDIAAICKDHDITFLCTPHEPSVLDFLVDDLEVGAIKIGSGEHRNYPFLEEIASRGIPVILSTGLHTSINDIQFSIKAVGIGGCSALAVLHCISQYPTPTESLQMRTMDLIREVFRGPVGFSDHTEHGVGSTIAIAKGADLVERHVMDNCSPERRDFKVATDVDHFGLFYTFRAIRQALGEGKDRCALVGEAQTAKWAEKSFVSTCFIAEGTVITEEMITVKRPGKGIPPSSKDRVIGKVASHSIVANMVIMGLEDQEGK